MAHGNLTYLGARRALSSGTMGADQFDMTPAFQQFVYDEEKEGEERKKRREEVSGASRMMSTARKWR